MEIEDYDELSEFLENELVFKDGFCKAKLSKIDLMRLCHSWKIKNTSVNPFLLSGEELNRTETSRKSGR